MNKKTLVKKIISHLTSELELYAKATRAARAEATHEQSKAEHKYDTRGLEASYLARGQSRQLMEIEEAIKEFKTLSLPEFGPADPIDLGALVELEIDREKLLYFVGPRSGGTEVVWNKKEVMVITPQSPLGQEIMGKRQGQKVHLASSGGRNVYDILAVL